jgi:hypothetical protein
LWYTNKGDTEMSKTNRSVHYITSIPNTIEGLKILADLREALKRRGLGTRVYGRCKNKRKVFEKNGRFYHPQSCVNSKNDISLKSPEATDCYEWALYFRPKITREDRILKMARRVFGTVKTLPYIEVPVYNSTGEKITKELL